MTLKAFTGAYIGFGLGFLERVASSLPKEFPRPGKRSCVRCRAFRWELPETAPLKDVA